MDAEGAVIHIDELMSMAILSLGSFAIGLGVGEWIATRRIQAALKRIEKLIESAIDVR